MGSSEGKGGNKEWGWEVHNERTTLPILPIVIPKPGVGFEKSTLAPINNFHTPLSIGNSTLGPATIALDFLLS